MDIHLPSSSINSLLFNKSEKQIAYDIYFRLKGMKSKPNNAMLYGIDNEIKVINTLKENGLKVCKVDSKKRNFNNLVLSATPDLIENINEINENLIEIKSPFYKKIVNYEEYLNTNNNFVTTIDQYYNSYKLQCQIQMFVFECNNLTFIVSCDDKLYYKEVTFDLKYLQLFQNVMNKINIFLNEINNRINNYDDIICISKNIIDLHSNGYMVSNNDDKYTSLIGDDVSKLRNIIGNDYLGSIVVDNHCISFLKNKTNISML